MQVSANTAICPYMIDGRIDFKIIVATRAMAIAPLFFVFFSFLFSKGNGNSLHKAAKE
jgi:hypothetical protein